MVAAYTSGGYEVFGEHPVTLTVADAIGTHDAWLSNNGSESAVVIAASNPFSQPISQTKNDIAHRHLLRAIASRSLQWARARGPDGSDCCCVFDVPDALAEHWLVTYQQNAALRIRKGGRPELVWHMRFDMTSEREQG